MTNITDSTITFTWEEQFDGYRNITGARLEYKEVVVGSITYGVDVGRKSAKLMGLKHFTFYSVALSIRNPLGLSSPVYLVERTGPYREFGSVMLFLIIICLMLLYIINKSKSIVL